MLSDYGIPNAATRIEDKETDLLNAVCSFPMYRFFLFLHGYRFVIRRYSNRYLTVIFQGIVS